MAGWEGSGGRRSTSVSSDHEDRATTEPGGPAAGEGEGEARVVQPSATEAPPDAADPRDRPFGRGGAHRRRHRGRRIALGLLGVVVVAVVAASLVQIPYYAITPGATVPVDRLFSIGGAGTEHRGRVLMVYVELTALHAIDYPYFALNSNATLYPNDEILGAATASQYQVQSVLEMSDAQQAATYVALHELGYHVTASPDGARLYLVQGGSPASRLLRVGDVITGIDGRPTRTLPELTAALEADRPGEAVRVGLRTYPSGRAGIDSIVLGEFRLLGHGAAASDDCVPVSQASRGRPVTIHDKPVACLGVEVEPNYALAGVPFPIHFDAEGIVGPSAGLAFTLGLLQKLDPDSLLNGRTIAATGTMSIDGAVGPIGGIKQKTIAVRDAGASVFFVPDDEYKVARSEAGRTLRIFAVSSIGQVLADLRSLGGVLASPRSTS
jgi:PDZ domain-containing protein